MPDPMIDIWFKGICLAQSRMGITGEITGWWEPATKRDWTLCPSGKNRRPWKDHTDDAWYAPEGVAWTPILCPPRNFGGPLIPPATEQTTEDPTALRYAFGSWTEKRLLEAFKQQASGQFIVGTPKATITSSDFDSIYFEEPKPIRSVRPGDHRKYRCKAKRGVDRGDIVWIADNAVWPRPRGGGSFTAVALHAARPGEEVTVSIQGETSASLTRLAKGRA